MMTRRLMVVLPVLVGCSITATAAAFEAGAVQGKFVDAFNNRQWDEVKAMLAEDSVFHRANASEVYAGPDAILDHFEQTIGGDWNVKFAVLDSQSAFTGNDGRVVERGDFAVTAGANDDSCYRGSYLATWLPQAGDDWQLQMLAWQDVETDLDNCK
jgi:ketosteroid isomerase-like protein